jgi:Domain of unknown function (DUF4926)
MMKAKKNSTSDGRALLRAVALLTGIPEQRLARGQVGTVVEQLDDDTVLVEFSDEQGRAYVIFPCQRVDLLVLHYAPKAA